MSDSVQMYGTPLEKWLLTKSSDTHIMLYAWGVMMHKQASEYLLCCTPQCASQADRHTVQLRYTSTDKDYSAGNALAHRNCVLVYAKRRFSPHGTVH